MNFLDLPLDARRAAFAKMDAADKAKKGAKLGKKSRKAAAKKPGKPKARKAAPSGKSGKGDLLSQMEDLNARMDAESGPNDGLSLEEKKAKTKRMRELIKESQRLRRRAR